MNQIAPPMTKTLPRLSTVSSEHGIAEFTPPYLAVDSSAGRAPLPSMGYRALEGALWSSFGITLGSQLIYHFSGPVVVASLLLWALGWKLLTELQRYSFGKSPRSLRPLAVASHSFPPIASPQP